MRRLLDSGVTAAEWVVLREMYDEEEVAPSMLAAKIGMTRGAASKLIDRLVMKRLVTRRDRTDDRRYQDVALTAEGRRLVPKLAVIADENDAEYFSGLSVAEHKALVTTLKKLVRVHGLKRVPME
jgi:DNA-binding MarR family transcriptional regulator